MELKKHTNPVLKIDIELDPNVLIQQEIDPEGAIELLRRNFTKTGLLEDSVEGCHIIYKTDGSNKGLAHVGLVMDGLLEAQWFKDACLKWDLIKETYRDSGEFVFESSIMKNAQKRGMW